MFCPANHGGKKDGRHQDGPLGTGDLNEINVSSLSFVIKNCIKDGYRKYKLLSCISSLSVSPVNFVGAFVKQDTEKKCV